MSTAERVCRAFICVAVLTLLEAPGALAVGGHPHLGVLPGFPRVRGVIPVLGSPAAVSARERLINGAFSARRSGAESNTEEGVCPPAFAFTQNVCYQGGPVLRDPTVHLIFWLGPTVGALHTIPTTPNVKAFPSAYRGTIERYFSDVAHDKGVLTDTYAVDPQYFDETGPGVNGSLFAPAADTTLDEEAFPSHKPEECSDPSSASEGPCLLDSDI
ncbi:MAG TPA: hypothetical protein VGF15_00245, partial [Solirubrobacteraceae bacterium]